VATLSAAELLDGGWAQRTSLLVMPGGADLPYCRTLNGAGNEHIRGAAHASWGARCQQRSIVCAACTAVPWLVAARP
jgi:hypothetical protein